MNVVWTQLAEDQAAEAFAYVAAEQPAAAVRWFEGLVAAIESLSTLPDHGRIVPEAGRESIRELFVGPYRVIYRRDTDVDLILTVQHQRRDLDLPAPGA